MAPQPSETDWRFYYDQFQVGYCDLLDWVESVEKEPASRERDARLSAMNEALDKLAKRIFDEVNKQNRGNKSL
jgi:hypothetical protein